jgi:Xaa-Pro aminopeptidase
VRRDGLEPAAGNIARPTLGHNLFMRFTLCLLICIAPICVGASTASVSPNDYKTRRADVRKSLDGVMVLFGAEESEEDLHDAFFQESNFLYLTGWREPGAVMLLTPTEEVLFLPPRDPQAENFSGRKTLPEDRDVTAKTGFEKVLPHAAIESTFLRMLATSRRIYTLPSDGRSQKLRAMGPLHEDANAARELARFRVVKSEPEVSLITKAVDTTVAAHLAAIKKVRPGLFEYEISAAATNAYFERGCERNAYAPIVGSGPNSVILHYMTNHRRVESGDLVLLDIGAECADYASDVTRTVPAGGKFTARQKEIYEIVLGAQKAAIAAAKPGARLRGEGRSLHQVAYDYINSHGKDVKGEPLGKYFTHGIGHFVGLDVHDPGDLTWPLQAGMVITVEPGIYIPDENIGVRIEDTLVVTENGAKNLSAGLPREVSEIEKLVGK